MIRTGLLIMAFVCSYAVADGLMSGDLGARSENSKTVMTLITEKGFVSVRIEDNWKIQGAHGKPPIANLTFQIDPEISLTVSFITPGANGTKELLDEIGKKYGDQEVKSSQYKGWQVYSQNVTKDCKCTIKDAKKSVADVLVYVRMSWPTEKNKVGVFNSFLDSVNGKKGTYTPAKDDVFRRMN